MGGYTKTWKYNVFEVQIGNFHYQRHNIPSQKTGNLKWVPLKGLLLTKKHLKVPLWAKGTSKALNIQKTRESVLIDRTQLIKTPL